MSAKLPRRVHESNRLRNRPLPPSRSRSRACGAVAEWSKALAWKVSIRQKRIEGSNPSRSAISAYCRISRRPSRLVWRYFDIGDGNSAGEFGSPLVAPLCHGPLREVGPASRSFAPRRLYVEPAGYRTLFDRPALTEQVAAGGFGAVLIDQFGDMRVATRILWFARYGFSDSGSRFWIGLRGALVYPGPWRGLVEAQAIEGFGQRVADGFQAAFGGVQRQAAAFQPSVLSR